MWPAGSTEDSLLVYAVDQTFGLPVIWDTLVLMWRHFYVYKFTWGYEIFQKDNLEEPKRSKVT